MNLLTPVISNLSSVKRYLLYEKFKPMFKSAHIRSEEGSKNRKNTLFIIVSEKGIDLISGKHNSEAQSQLPFGWQY